MKFTMDVVIEYAKVFLETRDMGEGDNDAARKAASTDGAYSINAYFTSEDQITQLLDNGMVPVVLSHPRIKEGRDFGIGKYLTLKRSHDHKMNFKDRAGKDVEVDFGGPPTMINLTNGKENKALWTLEGDGDLGHGTRAKIQFETYKNGVGLRLLNIAVLDHVVREDAVSEDDDLFVI